MKVGVALAGGGLKGVAYIGALKAFEELGIHIDCISGTSSGSMAAVLYSIGCAPEEMKKAMAQSLPMKRLGKDTEIADIICFLLSDEASFMTGSVLSCDGGFTAM